MPPIHRTRLAPTPSGYLHIGNALSFALTAALAQQHRAQTLLRIDDMDRDRIQPAYIQDIFDTLSFLNIPWTEGPKNITQYEQQYSQHHRLSLYENALQQLARQGKVYACTCSRAQILQHNAAGIYPGTCRHKQLPLDTKDAAWRIITDDTPLQVNTLAQGTVHAQLPPGMQDFIVRKKDGYPAYQLSSVVDDVHFAVDLIVRGKDLWDATLAQHFLAIQLQYATFTNAVFYHHPLLMETTEQKLSKSAGATSIHYLRTHGHSPAQVYADIAAALPLDGHPSTWQELAALVLPNNFYL
ncbi:tRNA glutamyl-Q synthetase [Chitinophaga parva]|uniref:tRNA glutamyl-Q synthetase n=1 Tax=Chitinophaga parva TaxID=2169414 RepID=A0A2T7BNW8_9BACT|nr:glutamate--tRNA ligase family protein [Chitinophaga parva]PUZ29375.1 tRNA glutamyl-Q synthetase [Chitinophaga parva]